MPGFHHLALLAFLVCPVALAQSPSSAHLEAAAQLYDQGYLALSVEAYDEALEIEETFDGYYGRAWATFEMDGGELAAREDLQRALELRPGDPDALFGRGFMSLYLDEPRAAVEDFDEYLRQQPDDAFALMARAAAFERLGRHSEAAHDRQQAARLDPTYQDYDPFALEIELADLIPVGIALLGFILLVGTLGLFFAARNRDALALRQTRLTQIRYDGSWKALLQIYLQNVVLTLLTFGIYRFWARVRSRQFHYQHTSVSGGRFDYHATGGEKFAGFLKGMVVLMLAILPLALLYFVARGVPDEDGVSSAANAALLLVVLALRPLILVGGQRFNLARTSWNHVRMRFTGRVGTAYRIYAADLLAMVFTLGLYWPWHVCRVRAFRMSHTQIGHARFEFDGDGSALLRILALGALGTPLTLGLCIPWVFAARHRFIVEHTKFNGRPLRSELTGGQVFAIAGPGLLATVLTLGLALPWAVTRWRRLLAHTTLYRGEIDAGTIEAIRDAGASSTIEGIGEAADILDQLGDFVGF